MNQQSPGNRSTMAGKLQIYADKDLTHNREWTRIEVDKD
jgi:hypothetical protein